MTTPQKAASLSLTLLLAGLSMFGPFNVDAPMPAFNDMGSTFHVSPAGMQLVVSVYLLSFAVMSLFHGPLSDSVGRKPVMVGGILLYVAASAGCALSTSLPMLLMFRALQGFSAGAGQIISRAVIRDLFDGAEARRLMSNVSMIFAVAPALAPIVGSVILSASTWQGIFWFLTLFGVLMTACVVFFLPETLPPEARQPMNVTKILRGMGRICSSPAFWRIALAGSVGFSAQFLYISNSSPFITSLLHRGPDDFWMFYVPMVLAMMVGSAVSARLSDKISMTRQAAYGSAFSLVASVFGVAVSTTSAAATLPVPLIAPVLIAFGMSLSFPTLQLAVLDLFPTSRGSAASAGTFVNLIVSALVAGLIGPAVSTSLPAMATTASAFALGGLALLYWHVQTGRRRIRA